jgi:hypothetical protein
MLAKTRRFVVLFNLPGTRSGNKKRRGAPEGSSPFPSFQIILLLCFSGCCPDYDPGRVFEDDPVDDNRRVIGDCDPEWRRLTGHYRLVYDRRLCRLYYPSVSDAKIGDDDDVFDFILADILYFPADGDNAAAHSEIVAAIFNLTTDDDDVAAGSDIAAAVFSPNR